MCCYDAVCAAVCDAVCDALCVAVLCAAVCASAAFSGDASCVEIHVHAYPFLFPEYRVIPGHRKHRNDPASVFPSLSTH